MVIKVASNQPITEYKIQKPALSIMPLNTNLYWSHPLKNAPKRTAKGIVISTVILESTMVELINEATISLKIKASEKPITVLQKNFDDDAT